VAAKGTSAAERTLTERELNRALLARQLLLEREGLSLPKALDRMGCLQAQYAPSMYIGLWSRVEGFERPALNDALEQRRVIQGTLMRATIHLVSKADYWPLAIAIRRARRESWLRSGGARRPSAAQFAAAAKKLQRALERGPLTQAQIVELVGDRLLQSGVGLWVDLVRVPPSGTWERRRADLCGLAEDWVGPPPEISHEDAVAHVVRRYLGAFGPAPAKDIAEWAGLPVKEIAAAIARMRLRAFSGPGGGELVDLPRAPLPDPDTPAPPRFLPVWDATLLVHARRTGILPEEHRPRIFNVKTPHSMNTFLVDGAVAGSWRYEKGAIKLDPFARLDRATRAALDEEAQRLAELHA
jgi:hypothetical protein